jgi:hypothetical protein
MTLLVIGYIAGVATIPVIVALVVAWDFVCLLLTGMTYRP